MGISPAEVRLRRLLAAAPRQANQTKLLHYVASMREQLATLQGESTPDDLALISPSKARDYDRSIDEIAEKIDSTISPDVWESLSNIDRHKISQSIPVDSSLDFELNESVLTPDILSPTLRKRRLQKEREGSASGGLKLDSDTNRLVDKHRQIQEALTDEMAMLSEQMKNNSRMMQQSLNDTERVLDQTEAAVEHSLSATNRANTRAGVIYKTNWKTGCFTWLVLFLMCILFVFMVLVIRIT